MKKLIHELKTIFREKAGMILPLVLVLMAAGAFIIVPGLWTAQAAMTMNRIAEDDTRAYYAADAGILDAYWKLKQENLPDPDPYQLYYSFTLTTPINGYIVTWEIVDLVTDGDNTIYSIRASTTPVTASLPMVFGAGTGINYYSPYIRAQGAPREAIIAEIERHYTYEYDSGYPFQYAVASTGGKLWIKSNVNINSVPINGQANVFANGELDVSTALSVFVNGKGYYTQGTPDCTRILNGGCVKTDPITFQPLNETGYWEKVKLGIGYPNPPPVNMPTSNYGTTTYVYDGENNRIKIDGTSNWVTLGSVKNPTYLGGAGTITYIDGNLILGYLSGSRFKLNGVLWVNGSVYVKNNTYIDTDPSQQSYILAHGNVGVDTDHGITFVTNSKIICATNNLNLISDSGSIVFESGIDGLPDTPVNVGVLYAPNGAIIINSNSDVVASAVLGKSVTLDSNVTINYDTNLKNNPPDGWELNKVASATITKYLRR